MTPRPTYQSYKPWQLRTLEEVEVEKVGLLEEILGEETNG